MDDDEEEVDCGGGFNDNRLSANGILRLLDADGLEISDALSSRT